jgi:hypothetical protein
MRENPCDAWQKMKDKHEPSQIMDEADLQIEFSNMTFDSPKLQNGLPSEQGHCGMSLCDAGWMH